MKSIVGLTYINTVGLVQIRVLFVGFLVVLPLVAMIYGKAERFVFYGLAALGATVIEISYSFYGECPFNAIWLAVMVDVILTVLLLSSLIL